jgi:hypothetical protein
VPLERILSRCSGEAFCKFGKRRHRLLRISVSIRDLCLELRAMDAVEIGGICSNTPSVVNVRTKN